VIGGDFMRDWATLQASASFGRSMDEVEKTSSFLPFFLLPAQVSPQQRALSGERLQRTRGGPGDGMGCSGSTCDDVGARGCRWTRRRGAFPPLFQTVESQSRDSESDSFTRPRTRRPTPSVLLSYGGSIPCFLVSSKNNTSNSNNNK
jgi:hypothetical protein